MYPVGRSSAAACNRRRREALTREATEGMATLLVESEQMQLEEKHGDAEQRKAGQRKAGNAVQNKPIRRTVKRVEACSQFQAMRSQTVQRISAQCTTLGCSAK